MSWNSQGLPPLPPTLIADFVPNRVMRPMTANSCGIPSRDTKSAFKISRWLCEFARARAVTHIGLQRQRPQSPTV